MSSWKLVGAWAFASLVLGGLLVSALEGRALWAPHEIQVPVSRVGDEFTYDHGGTGTHDPFLPIPDPNGFPPLPALHSSVDAAPTHMSLERLAMVATHDGTLVKTLVGAGSGVRQYIDMERRTVRLDWPAGSLPLGGTFFSPSSGGNDDYRFRFQGERYEPGHPVDPVRLAQLSEIPWLALEAQRKLSVDGDLSVFSGRDTVRAFVAGTGRVGSWDAVVLRLEIFDAEAQTGCRFQGPCTKTGTLFLRREVWLSDDVPYPLLMSTIVTGQVHDERILWERKNWLLDYVPGGGPTVPWDEEHREPAPAVERTAGPDHVPADGTGETLVYPLSRALEDVRSLEGALPTLGGYGLWRLQHPDAFLVSARLAAGRIPGDAHPVWLLTFMEPQGSARDVLVQRGANGPTLSSYGRNSLPPTTPADLDQRSPTIAASIDLWRRFADARHQTHLANQYQWGAYSLVPEQACAPYEPGPSLVFGNVAVGWGTQTLCGNGEETDHSLVVLDARTGLMVMGFDGAPGPDEASSTPPRRPPPTLEAGVVLGLSGTGSVIAASAALFSLGALAYGWPLARWWAARTWLAVFGYSKLVRDQVLDHRTRDRIVEQVRQNPGIHASELARRVGCGWGTLVHHVGVLERNGVLTAVVDGRHRRFFTPQVGDRVARQRLTVLANPATKALFDLIAARPGLAAGALAEGAGLHRPTATWHLKRLEAAGLVRRVRDGRLARFEATAART